MNRNAILYRERCEAIEADKRLSERMSEGERLVRRRVYQRAWRAEQRRKRDIHRAELKAQREAAKAADLLRREFNRRRQAIGLFRQADVIKPVRSESEGHTIH